MAASEKSEVFLAVLKRIGKWLLWLVAALVMLVVILYGWIFAKEYFDNRPYQITKYAEISIGDSREEVLYALGEPPEFIETKPSNNVENQFKEFNLIAQSNDYYEETPKFKKSKEWLYTEGERRIDIAFDMSNGRVKSIACYSGRTYLCPYIFGIHDGSREEDVLSHLGKPTSEKIDGITKVIRYSQYNLTLYLTKRQVYMLKVSKDAD